MIYLVYGEDYFLVDDKLNELSKKYPKYAVYSFDGSNGETPVAQITEAARSQSLFGEASFIMVRHPSFFYRKMEDKEKKELEDYVNDPSFNCDLVFYESGAALPNSSAAYKIIVKNARVFAFGKLKPWEFADYARGYISSLPLKVSRQGVDLIIERSHGDTGMLHLNCRKLMLYGDTCTEKVVDKLCPAELDDDIFKLVNAITEKDLSRAFYYLDVYEQMNQNYSYLISVLANQYRFLYTVSYLRDQGMNTAQILKETSPKSKSDYRVKKAYETLRMLNRSDILKILDKLHLTDKALKSGDQIAARQHMARFLLETAGIA